MRGDQKFVSCSRHAISRNVCSEHVNMYTGRESNRRACDEIVNLIEEVVALARQLNLEVDSDEVRELLDSLKQELTIDGLIFTS
ncbi:hypothetical protein TNCV_4197771 [Trichonephila clavipes]|nr:hypothetical protein TNCV_4197771 [Trichonephila clavipes]